MAEIIWPGKPGSTWKNETDKAAFQFFCSFVNSCELCMSLHTSISFFPWPIPMHDHCGCFEVIVFPEAESEPFVHFDDYLKQLSDDEIERSIGQSVYRLIKKGVVAWGDVVTPDRIKTLAEVVKAKNLTVDQMVAAGITLAVAQRAVNYSKTDVAEIIRRHRDELMSRVSEAAKWAAELRHAVAAGAKGARLSGLGSPGWPSQVVGHPLRPAGLHTGLPSGGAADAELLAKYLARWPKLPPEYLWWVIEDAQKEWEKKHAHR